MVCTEGFALADAKTTSSRLDKLTFARSFELKYMSSLSCANAQIPEVIVSRDNKIDFVFIWFKGLLLWFIT